MLAAYGSLKENYNDGMSQYPEFMNMFMMLMSRDSRKYIEKEQDADCSVWGQAPLRNRE